MGRKYVGVLGALVMFTAVLLSSPTQAAGEKIAVCHVPPGNPENAHTIHVSRRAYEKHLAHGDREGSCDQVFAVAVDANRSYGVIGTAFELSAASTLSSTDLQYQWEIGDGRTFSGESISLSFAEAGFFSVSLTATDASGNTAEADVGLVVHDPNDSTPDVLGLPDHMGDLNQDGRITLVDAHLAAKFAGRVEHLAAEQQRASDLDFSGTTSSRDVELISGAILDDSPLPDRLIQSRGQPGSFVTLVSPKLLNPRPLVQIKIGDSTRPITPNRPVLGYATFAVPLTGDAATPGPKEFVLLADGNEIGRYPFTVLEAEPTPPDPVADLTAFFDGLRQLMATNEAVLAEQLDSMQITEQSRSVLMAPARAGQLQADAALDELERLLASEHGSEIAALFLKVANANGLAEYRGELQSFVAAPGSTGGTFSAEQFAAIAAFGPDEVCDELLPALCALKTSAGLMNTGSDIVSGACDLLLAAALAAVLYPGDAVVADAALLSSWAAACAPLEFAIDAAAVISDLVSDIDADLRLSASTTTPAAGAPAILKASLEVFGVDDVCQLGGSEAADKIVEKLAERAVNRLIMRKITMRAMSKIFEQLGEDYLQKFLGLLEEAAQEAIEATQIDSAILEFAQPYCEGIYGAELVMNASRVLTGPDPNEGTLTFLSDGTAEYMCPDDPGSATSSQFTFTAEKDICGEVKTKTLEVACATREVTITMGDNGNLNDDIYEVRVNGETVLTTSSPVRSASTTVELSVGSIVQVQMLGRAAPDGVGTYYISFSGARVIAGDATSGSDLVPGAVKSFTLEVLP